MTGDIASELVAGVDRFLLRQIEQSTAAAGQALEARLQLGSRLQRLGRAQPQAAGAYPGGARSAGAAPTARSSSGTSTSPDLLRRRARQYSVFAVRWPAFGDVTR